MSMLTQIMFAAVVVLWGVAFINLGSVAFRATRAGGGGGMPPVVKIVAQVIVSAFVLALVGWVILSHQYSADDTKSAWGALASVASFWLGKA